MIGASAVRHAPCLQADVVDVVVEAQYEVLCLVFGQTRPGRGRCPVGAGSFLSLPDGFRPITSPHPQSSCTRYSGTNAVSTPFSTSARVGSGFLLINASDCIKMPECKTALHTPPHCTNALRHTRFGDIRSQTSVVVCPSSTLPIFVTTTRSLAIELDGTVNCRPPAAHTHFRPDDTGCFT